MLGIFPWKQTRTGKIDFLSIQVGGAVFMGSLFSLVSHTLTGTDQPMKPRMSSKLSHSHCTTCCSFARVSWKLCNTRAGLITSLASSESMEVQNAGEPRRRG
jgi:hypothetical protein